MSTGGDAMLCLRFLNVADGDAILVEDGDFRMLVDAGRDIVAFDPPAADCAAHLKALGVRHIDLAVITHLHIDHMGGLERIMDEGIAIDRLVSGYFPSQPGLILPASLDAEDTVEKMTWHLDLWSEQIARLMAAGTRCEEIRSTVKGLRLTERLEADITLPDVAVQAFQDRVWEAMFHGGAVSYDEQYAASKLRNPNSLRVRLRYAGREIELSGDCLGAVWEREDIAPCDLFKVPHHGDAKSVTELLVEKLRPAHAVISTGRTYLPEKDRPSRAVATLLRECGAQVWYTDSVDDGVGPVRRWPYVRFIIREDGALVPPSGEEP